VFPFLPFASLFSNLKSFVSYRSALLHVFLLPLLFPASFKNAYNLQVKQSAKPCFPVEYLLVNLTHGFPNTPSPLFTSSKKSSPFPIENRQLLQGDPQNTGKVVSSLVPIVGNGVYDEEGEGEMRRKVEEWASDWHLLSYLDREAVLGEVRSDHKPFSQVSLPRP
jgi:hypothetical protein